MITRVALDSKALLDHKDSTRVAVNTHRSLVQVLESYGFIQLLGPADSAALVRAIKSLPTEMGEIGEYWEKAIVRLMDLNRVHIGSFDRTAGDLCAEEPLPEPLRSLADLVIVSERACSDRAPLRVNGFDKRVGEPEVALADSITQCQTIESARFLRELGNFRADTQRDDIWDEVFAAPAALSTEATLLDRFFLEHVLNGKSRDLRDHVEWLIGKLDESMSDGSTLRLLCGWPVVRGSKKLFPRNRIEASVRKRIASCIGDGRLDRIQVILTPWPKRQDGAPHNRHIRFNAGVAISTEEGFDRLDQTAIQGIDGFSWRPITSATLLGDLTTRENVICTHPDRFELQVPE